MSAFHGSSAINKSGKKFAPKVARRRPAAVSGSEAASATSSAEQTPVGTPAASATPANEPAQPETQHVLPTPPATQAPSQAQPAVAEQSTSSTVQSASILSTPVLQNDGAEAEGRSPKRRKVELSTPGREAPTETGHSVPSTRSDVTALPVTVLPSGQPAASNIPGTSAETTQEAASNTHDIPSHASVPELSRPAEEQNNTLGPAPQDGSEDVSASSVPKSKKVAQPKTVKRRGAARLSNKDLIREVMGENSGVTKPSTQAPTTEQSPTNDGDTQGVGSDNTQHQEEQTPQADGEAQSLNDVPVPNRPPKRTPNVTAARKRKQKPDTPARNDQPAAEEQVEPEVTPATSGSTQPTVTKKPRQPRPRKRAEEDIQNPADGPNEDAAAPKPKRPRRKPKTPARVTEEGGGTEGTEAGGIVDPAEEQGIATRKRPKNILDHLVFDEEDRENPEKTRINSSSMPMGVLTRDISLVGTISQREEALSKIDWDEEKRKRMEERERIALGEEQAQTQAERDDALARLQEAANTAAASTQAPQMRVVNGVLTLDHSSTQVDRNARAREDAEELQEIEEDELTTRVNQMSWIKANRKDPRERTSWGPTRADRWSDEQTDMFYDALKMFGTDFFIISKMFPGKTRANVKRKFVKEERLDPDRIKRALIGESVPMDFEEYKRKTGKDDDFFRDPEQLRQELAQETEQQRQEVEEAQARYAEQQRQRKLAKQGGADVDGEEGEGGKKGRKKKGEGKKGKKSKAPIGGEEIEVVEFEGDELEHRR